MIGNENLGACHAPVLKQNRKGWRAEMAETIVYGIGEEQRVKGSMTKGPRHICPGRLAAGGTEDLS